MLGLPRRLTRRVRLQLEPLAERINPTTNRWLNLDSGFWHDAANWSLGRVPTRTDTVILDVTSTPTVMVVGDAEAYQLTNAENLIIDAGTLAITKAGFTDVVRNTGTLTVGTEGQFISQGNLSNAGPIRLEPGSHSRIGTNTILRAGSVLRPVIDGRPDAGRYGSAELGADLVLLGGSLQITLADGFVPFIGDRYPLFRNFPDDLSLSLINSQAPYFSLVKENGNLVAVVIAGEPAPAEPPVFTLDEVTGPATATSNDVVPIQWEVTNDGTESTTGPWDFRLALAINSAPEGEEVNISDSAAVGTFAVGTGITLAPGASTFLTANVPLPAVRPDTYRWLLRHEETETLSADEVAYTLPMLTIDGPATPGVFTTPDSDTCYQLDVPAATALVVSLNVAETDFNAQILLGRGFLPTTTQFTAASPIGSSVVAALQADGPETWFVRVRGNRFNTTTPMFTVSVTEAVPQVDTVSPNTIGNAGTATLVLTGVALPSNFSYYLTASGQSRPATAVAQVEMNQVAATFDVAAMAEGVYTVEVRNGNGVLMASLPHAVTVEAANQGNVEVALFMPDVVRTNRRSGVTVQFRNTGNIDAPLPFLTLVAEGDAAELRLQQHWAEGRPQVTFIPASPVPGARMLPAGAQGEVTVWFSSTTSADYRFKLYADDVRTPFGSVSLNWAAIAKDLRPPGVPNATWNAHLAVERAKYGATIRDLHRVISDELALTTANGFANVIYAGGRVYFDQAPVEFSGQTRSGSTSTNRSAPQGTTATGPDGMVNVQTLLIDDVTLPGSTDDVNGLKQLLSTTSGLNLPTGSITTTRTVPTTAQDPDFGADDYLNWIRETLERADPGEPVVIVNGSHGLKEPGRDGDRSTLALGQKKFENGLDPAALNALFEEFSDRRIFFVNDACYSGMFNREITASNVTAIASYEFAPTPDRPSFGYYFVKHLQQANGTIDLIEVSHLAAREFAADYRTLDGNRDFSGKSLLRAQQQFDAAVSHWRHGSFERRIELDANGQLRPATLADFKALSEQQPGLVDTYTYNAWPYPVFDLHGANDFVLPSVNPKALAERQVQDEHELDPADAEGLLSTRGSFDPNEKVGPTGTNGYVFPDARLTYEVHFENDPNLATLPAQIVTITDELDADLDLDTFVFGDIVIGRYELDVPDGATSIDEIVDLETAGVSE